MLAAIVSDIHGNLQALEAVLAHIKRGDAEQIWCLGDVVGYGADPDACAALIAERADLCLAGNHDLVVRGDLDINHFTSSAGVAARWTMATIAPRTRAFLDRLAPLDRSREVGLYHASPRDPIWEYVLSVDKAHDCLGAQGERVCLVGHSHVACYFFRAGEDTDGTLAPAGTTITVGESKWLINPGSVGQPRDGDPRASYLTLDTDSWSASFHRVEYPADRAAEAIRAAGLPHQLADRLRVGR